MQLRFTKRIALASFFAFTLALVPVAAYADHGSADSGSGDGSTNTSASSGSGDTTSSSTGTNTESSGTSDNTTSNTTETEHHGRSTGETEMAKELDQKHEVNMDHHLNTGQLKSCEARTQAVSNIMSRIVTRGTNQTDLFTTIANRAEAFYAQQGKTLADYDTLVAAVNSAQTKAQTDLQTMKDEGTFSCSSSNPKGQVAAFQDALKTEIQDLNSFKTAVKNLIVGVKSVTGSTTGGNQ